MNAISICTQGLPQGISYEIDKIFVEYGIIFPICCINRLSSLKIG